MDLKANSKFYNFDERGIITFTSLGDSTAYTSSLYPVVRGIKKEGFSKHFINFYIYYV